MIKYADDTVIVRLITNSDETNYKTQIEEVSPWCQSHNFLLNVYKTKEIIFDFRHCIATKPHFKINNDLVEICEKIVLP